MFYEAANATPDTSSWNTQQATKMESMFSGAFVAKPDTSNWKTAAVTNINSMFLDAILANTNMSSWQLEQEIDGGLAETKNAEIRFTPDDGFVGEVIITYQIIDLQGRTA